MSSDDRAGVVEALLYPLMLPRRAVRDLHAVGAAARSLPDFEEELISSLDGLASDLGGLRTELTKSLERLGTLERLTRRMAPLKVVVPEPAGELGATKRVVSEITDLVAGVVEPLPDPESRGPIARAPDALGGAESPGMDKRMEIPEQKVLELLRDRGNHDEAEAADGELPDAVDTDRDAGLLTKFGVHPPELLAGL